MLIGYNQEGELKSKQSSNRKLSIAGEHHLPHLRAGSISRAGEMLGLAGGSRVCGEDKSGNYQCALVQVLKDTLVASGCLPDRVKVCASSRCTVTRSARLVVWLDLLSALGLHNPVYDCLALTDWSGRLRSRGRQWAAENSSRNCGWEGCKE